MEQLPEFWRTEVWHPLSVHLPIGLLIMATIFKLISLIAKRLVWEEGGSILLYIGTVGAWVSVYTGTLADATVTRSLCDPTVLEAHENAAYTMAWIFTIAAIADIINWLKLFPIKKLFLKISIALLLLTGSSFLLYVGHLGASLVYQQGAGVYKPSEDCREFNY